MFQPQLSSLVDVFANDDSSDSHGLISILDFNRLLVDLLEEFVSHRRLFDIKRYHALDDEFSVPEGFHDRHLILVDPETPGVGRMQGVQRLIAEYPNSKVVLFSNRIPAPDVAAARQFGAWGYISKNMSPMSVCSALLLIASNEKYFQYDPAPAVGREAAIAQSGLSAMETEVQRLVAAGRTNREIADATGISEPMVKTHVRSLMAKTRCRNRTQLAIHFLTGDTVE